MKSMAVGWKPLQRVPSLRPFSFFQTSGIGFVVFFGSSYEHAAQIQQTGFGLAFAESKRFTRVMIRISSCALLRWPT